ncbi:MAG: hypothetical protein M1820_005222 [Bogoriella megaspora]|nr:MAG: hypothetical protein M1820_005222 [Bogoriella megaspora]
MTLPLDLDNISAVLDRVSQHYSSVVKLVLAFATALFSLGLWTIISRLCFSPIAHFPGPKLAAVTSLYELYCSIVLKGQWAFRIKEMHEKYGPIVRISPTELHIDDPAFYYELYTQKLNRIGIVGSHLSTTATVRSDVHRKRRAAFAPFLSRSSIESKSLFLNAKTLQLCDRFEQARKEGSIINLPEAFTGLTVDVITQFTYGESANTLSLNNFGSTWRYWSRTLARIPVVYNVFPRLPAVLGLLPQAIVKLVFPAVALAREYARTLGYHVDITIAQTLSQNQNETNTGKHSKATLFEQILSSGLPAAELSKERLVQEGLVFIGAGTETTARALSLISYYLVDKPHILEEVHKELDPVFEGLVPGQVPSWASLEKLPYLTAVIKEGLRTAGSNSIRSPRITERPMTYRNYTVPAGTPVSMTNWNVLSNSQLFPQPEEFVPERWLKVGPKGKGEVSDLDHYQIAFGKGPRQCAGMHLASMELYTTIAMLFWRFKLELYETDFDDDVRPAHDWVVMFAKSGSKGIRVKVTGLRHG